MNYYYSRDTTGDTLKFAYLRDKRFFFSQTKHSELESCNRSTVYNEVFERSYKKKSGVDTLTFRLINGNPESSEFSYYEGAQVLLEIQLGDALLSFEAPELHEMGAANELSLKKGFKTKNDSFYLEYTTKSGMLKLYRHNTGETWSLIQ